MHMWKLGDVEQMREQPVRAIVHKSCVLCIIPTADGIMTSTQFGTVRFWPLVDILNVFRIGDDHFRCCCVAPSALSRKPHCR